jgi:HYD1 signature containing ADP-ribosyltransferase
VVVVENLSKKDLSKTHTKSKRKYMLKLYHYTDEEAFRSIKREGVIRTGTMNKYGTGVYLTNLDPVEYTRAEVAKSNSGVVGAQRSLERGCLDYHIPIHISSHEVHRLTMTWYRYPHEMLRLDDYSTQNADANQRWIQRSMQTAMVVGGGVLVVTGAAVAVTSGPMAVVGGAVAVARLCQAADWLSNRRDHQGPRRIELKQTLDRIVNMHSKQYATKRIGSDGVCIACQRCKEHVTDVYHGGALWASHVDHREVITRLSEHDQMHLKRVVARILAVAMAVWMYQYGGRNIMWACSISVAVVTTICTCVAAMWIASNL